MTFRIESYGVVDENNAVWFFLAEIRDVLQEGRPGRPASHRDLIVGRPYTCLFHSGLGNSLVRVVRLS